MKDSTQLIDWLVCQEPTVVRDWLNEVWKGEKQIPTDFYWPHLAAAVEVQARAGNGPKYYSQPSIEWARIAILLYQYLINNSDDLERSSLEIGMMALKAHLILHFPSLAEDSTFCINQIVEWFFASLPFSLQRIEEKCKHLEILPDEDLLRLRFIKERLEILRWLLEKKLISLDDNLGQWFAIREKLP